jgi:hypothetical protein
MPLIRTRPIPLSQQIWGFDGLKQFFTQLCDRG